MSSRRWVPRLPTTKRIAGRLLRAHRRGIVALDSPAVDVCIDGLTRGFVPTALREQLGRLWVSEGRGLLDSGFVDPTRSRHEQLDAALDALARRRVE